MEFFVSRALSDRVDILAKIWYIYVSFVCG